MSVQIKDNMRVRHNGRLYEGGDVITSISREQEAQLIQAEVAVSTAESQESQGKPHQAKTTDLKNRIEEARKEQGKDEKQASSDAQESFEVGDDLFEMREDKAGRARYTKNGKIISKADFEAARS